MRGSKAFVFWVIGFLFLYENVLAANEDLYDYIEDVLFESHKDDKRVEKLSKLINELKDDLKQAPTSSSSSRQRIGSRDLNEKEKKVLEKYNEDTSAIKGELDRTIQLGDPIKDAEVASKLPDSAALYKVEVNDLVKNHDVNIKEIKVVGKKTNGLKIYLEERKIKGNEYDKEYRLKFFYDDEVIKANNFESGAVREILNKINNSADLKINIKEDEELTTKIREKLKEVFKDGVSASNSKESDDKENDEEKDISERKKIQNKLEIAKWLKNQKGDYNHEEDGVCEIIKKALETKYKKPEILWKNLDRDTKKRCSELKPDHVKEKTEAHAEAKKAIENESKERETRVNEMKNDLLNAASACLNQAQQALQQKKIQEALEPVVAAIFSEGVTGSKILTDAMMSTGAGTSQSATIMNNLTGGAATADKLAEAVEKFLTSGANLKAPTDTEIEKEIKAISNVLTASDKILFSTIAQLNLDPAAMVNPWGSPQVLQALQNHPDPNVRKIFHTRMLAQGAMDQLRTQLDGRRRETESRLRPLNKGVQAPSRGGSTLRGGQTNGASVRVAPSTSGANSTIDALEREIEAMTPVRNNAPVSSGVVGGAPYSGTAPRGSRVVAPRAPTNPSSQPQQQAPSRSAPNTRNRGL